MSVVRFERSVRALSRATVLAGFIVSCTASATYAGGAALYPQTKLRVTVVSWMPTKSEYQVWAPLGGDFVVSPDNALSLPVVGTIKVGELDSDGLAAEIASKLQSKIGLVTKPDATVEVLEYAPVYVAGSVTKPGEYSYRPGMTVLQALALGGGLLR